MFFSNFTILDWSTAFLSKDNGIPANVRIGNCLITRNKELLSKSDAVVVEVRSIAHLKDMPQHREPWQRWIYLNTESPFYFTTLDYVNNYKTKINGNYKMNDFKGKLAFNWTMTHRGDSDVPLIQGFPVEKTPQERSDTIIALLNRKKKLVAGEVNNCIYVTNGRSKYMAELKKHLELDIYGKCGTLQCAGHYSAKHGGCQKVKEYKFFLAFENSNCRDYISEKIWVQAFDNEAVPVVMGGNREDYVKLVPPGSFIHTDDFESPRELAAYLKRLDKNEAAYMKYHEWRATYKTKYEVKFLGTYVWERMCIELNKRYRERPQWHKIITDFENAEKDCYLNKWVSKVCNGTICQ